MAKKSSHDFSQPTRQSLIAILIIAYNLYKVIVRNLIPLFIAIWFGGSAKSKGTFLVYAIITLAITAAIYSLIAFFKYYFFLQGDKLIVQKGVFKKTRLEIPFDRIQSINFEQNILHRIFKVVKLNMDTAGSAKDEVQLNALNMDQANDLRSYILRNQSAVSSKESESISHVETYEEKKEIFRLTLPQLIKVGVTANHLRSGGLILLFFGYIYDSLEDFGLDLVEKLEGSVPMIKEVAQSLVIVLFIIALFFVVSFILSIVNTILRYFNLRMFRSGKGFVIESGLFNRKQQAAKDNKIQLIEWSQNLLQKLGKIYQLGLKQASSIEANVKTTFNVVGLSQENISAILSYLYKERSKEYKDIEWKKVNGYYLYRRIYYWTVGATLALIIIWFTGDTQDVVYIGLLYGFGWMVSYLSFKKKRFGVSTRFLSVQGGVFGHSVKLIEKHKIQSIRLNSTPFQRRRKLGSVQVLTASGPMHIPDVDMDTAAYIKNKLIYNVEQSNEEWM